MIVYMLRCSLLGCGGLGSASCELCHGLLFFDQINQSLEICEKTKKIEAVYEGKYVAKYENL